MSRPTVAYIDLNALKHNFKRVQDFAPNSSIISMVKADAYGHGIATIASSLPNSNAFGVSCIEEALHLREQGIQNEIILMEGVFFLDELELANKHNFQMIIHHQHQLDLLKSIKNFTHQIWIKVDTGMHRLGFHPDEVSKVWNTLKDYSPLLPKFMTHFSDADDVSKNETEKQIDLFNLTVEPFQTEKSLANSAGVIAWPKSHANWVRPGIMLYGVAPLLHQSAAEMNLKPVMTLKSKIIAIRDCHPGESVGYGSNWTCSEKTRIAVIPIGYGDGYPRQAKNGTPVLINGKLAPLVGRVSMDLITVDLANCPEAKIGSDVTLWGDELPVETVATYTDSIAYQLLCGIKARVIRKILSD